MIDIKQVLERATTRPWEARTNALAAPPHIVRVFHDSEGRKVTQFICGELNTCGEVDGIPNAELIVAAVNSFESNRELIRELAEALKLNNSALENLVKALPSEALADYVGPLDYAESADQVATAALAKVREAGL